MCPAVARPAVLDMTRPPRQPAADANVPSFRALNGLTQHAIRLPSASSPISGAPSLLLELQFRCRHQRRRPENTD